MLPIVKMGSTIRRAAILRKEVKEPRCTTIETGIVFDLNGLEGIGRGILHGYKKGRRGQLGNGGLKRKHVDRELKEAERWNLERKLEVCRSLAIGCKHKRSRINDPGHDLPKRKAGYLIDMHGNKCTRMRFRATIGYDQRSATS